MGGIKRDADRAAGRTSRSWTWLADELGGRPDLKHAGREWPGAKQAQLALDGGGERGRDVTKFQALSRSVYR